MCGRYAITLPPEAIRAWFRYIEQPNFPPRHNIAPTQPIPIVTRDDARIGDPVRHFRLVRWGLLPPFVKDPKTFPLLFNARADGIVSKPSFRAAMMRRRCLVIADGWYEWRRAAPRGPGDAFLFRRRDRAPIGFAGLFEHWMGPEGSELDTACIVTTDASPEAAAVHPRMPVMIEPADFETWLDVDGVEPNRAATLLRSPAAGMLEIIPVGPAVNKVANDDPSVQRPLRPATPDDPQGALF